MAMPNSAPPTGLGQEEARARRSARADSAYVEKSRQCDDSSAQLLGGNSAKILSVALVILL